MTHSKKRFLTQYTSILILALIFYNDNIYAQNIINPYQDWASTASNPIAPPSYFSNSSQVTIYDTDPNALPDLGTNWTGEYQIALRDLYCHADAQYGAIYPRNYDKSYIMETVSFPFVPSCAFLSSGCAGPSIPPLPRNFYLPTVAYSNGMWGDLSKNTAPAPFDNGNDGLLASTYYALTGYAFIKNASLAYTNPHRDILPQTIIKHTVRIHCLLTNDVAYELSFVYDNTRGRMRWYPFKEDNNSSNAQAPHYDVMLRPVLHVKPETIPPTDFSILYNENANSGWFDNGSISYFKCQEIPNSCSGGIPNCNSGVFLVYDGLYNYIPQYDNIYPSPYSLLSGFLFGNAAADILAGYDYSIQGGAHYEYKGAHKNMTPNRDMLQHHYSIDQNFDITLINPSEKVFYNPSESDITATDLHFPNNYNL